MKNKILLVVCVIVAVLAFAGIYILYNSLSNSYAPDRFAEYNTSEENTSSNAGNNEIKNKAPDFTVYDIDGNEVKLSDYLGKPVVINFWATWCGYCVKEMPDFNEAYKNYPDVQFLMINATDGQGETVEKASAYIEEQGFEFPVFYDTAFSAVSAYEVSGFPESYFIDAEGNLVTYAEGMISYDDLVRGIEIIENK